MKYCFYYDRVISKALRTYRKIKCQHKYMILEGNIKLNHNVTIYPDVMIFGDGPITIGDNVNIGNRTIIYASKSWDGVTIGNDVWIAVGIPARVKKYRENQ